MYNVLVAIPVNPSYPDALRQRALRLVTDMIAVAPPWCRVDVVFDDRPVTVPEGAPKYTRHAMARNQLLDTYLTDQYDTVLWIDADLIDYPANILETLLTANPGGIAAPFIYLDHHNRRFYDIGGFIHRGKRFPMNGPYPGEDAKTVELDSVGCLYTFPAWLYRAGVRYSPPDDLTYVEHWSVMRAAVARGVSIVALPQVGALHAWLPDYGLPLSI